MLALNRDYVSRESRSRKNIGASYKFFTRSQSYTCLIEQSFSLVLTIMRSVIGLLIIYRT